MSSSTHARARRQNSANAVLTLFLGFLLMASAWVTRHETARDPYAQKTGFVSFTHTLKQAVAPAENIEVTPSVFDQEAVMTPLALMTRWEPLIAEASRRFQLPATWIRAVLRMESGGRTVLTGNA